MYRSRSERASQSNRGMTFPTVPFVRVGERVQRNLRKRVFVLGMKVSIGLTYSSHLIAVILDIL
jgi:hypothetical protein